jgi:hypothetical protein
MDEMKLKKLTEALADLDIAFPPLNFIVRDSLSTNHPDAVVVHEVDRTPVVFDPEHGEGRLRERCFRVRDLDVGGRAATGRDGKMTWRLSDFLCEKSGWAFLDPVSFVATAQAKTNVTITAGAPATGADVTIEVFSWDANGAPAPNVRFSWRFWAPSSFIVQ